jgi:hypothetical protein
MKQIHLWRQWGPGFRAYPKLIEPREPQFALVDDADYPWLNQWEWYVMGPGNDLAIRCVLRIGDGLRTGYMHRMIMESYHGPDLRHVEHLDGNLLNNQRFNLSMERRRAPATRRTVADLVAGGTVAVK